MATPISKLDNFKLETKFGDGYVENRTYNWKLSKKQATGKETWRRVKMIGAGAFGSVWLEKELGGQLRAVKMLQRHVIQSTGFSQELASLITLSDHHHLFVEFYGWFENENEIFFAMEYIVEGDLSGYMADHETAKSNAGEITKQILEGLQILHKEGICHRDLKPQNILIASREPVWVKIADFGTSKRSTHTALRTRCGTDGYIAPELLGLLKWNNSEEFSFALDMWSLGCVAYELLTSQRLFCEVDGSFDSMTGLDTVPDGEQPPVNMQLLCDYCVGRTEFPTDVLAASDASVDAIALVQSFLIVEPTARATASAALRSPWISSIEFKNKWFKQLEADFLELGIELDIQTRQDKALMRQIGSIDIARFLPTSTVDELPALLEQSVEKGLLNAVSMLINSSRRIVDDPLGVQRLFEQAVIEGRLEWAKILIEVGKVDINRSHSSDGRTVLELAVHHGQCDIVQLLIDNNARAEPAAAKSYGGRTIFQVAAGRGDTAMVKLLLTVDEDITPIVNAKPATESGRTALQAAAEHGHIDIIPLLILNGADINAKPALKSGRTALQAAAEKGHLDIVVLLLGAGADVNATPSAFMGITPLWVATGNGRIDIVKILLEHGGDVNYELGGKTALHAAIQNGDLDIVQLLLKYEAKISGALLHTVVHNGQIDMVKALLESNADVNFKRRGETVLQVAVKSGRVEVVGLLLNHNANINDQSVEPRSRTELQRAAGNGDIDLVRLLHQHKANINAKPASDSGRTALQAAAEGGHLAVADFLLRSGATVNDHPANDYGRTALQAAAGNGHIDLVILLLNLGARVDANPAPCFGRTALQAAVEGGHMTVVELLLQHNANVNEIQSNVGGVTALGAAMLRNDLPMIQLLQANGALDPINRPVSTDESRLRTGVNIHFSPLMGYITTGTIMLVVLFGIPLYFVMNQKD